MKTFQLYLLKEAADLFEADILSILNILKDRISKLLKEDVGQIDEKKLKDYLKFVAIFEQFFRFLSAKRIDLSEVFGLNQLLNNKDLDSTNEDTLNSKIESIIQRFHDHSFINFKHIVQRRYDEFVKMVASKDRDDLEIVDGAIDFTIKSIRQYQQAT